MTKIMNVPVHLGIILDGNRRWARDRGIPTLEGHRSGYSNFKVITKAAINRGVSYVSAYIFSTENWNRTKGEVKYLMGLAYQMVTKDVEELNKEGIRVVWFGSRERLSNRLIKALVRAEDSTKQNTKGTLILCFNYGGQQEIVDAARILIDEGCSIEDVTQDKLEQSLYHPEIPPVDLMLRTSGEMRLSNFMLWRAAYSELAFVKKYWPDFTETDLDDVLADFAHRQRRNGS